ncbi:hypothetical protein EBBID32_24310 [Sphingobium indicum BiD32]|uniref:Uncharacterized protein n=1 Tax=Sphingobium indicum BiD32 TaxID=1301087 RepID=N1MM86_9SPHN|nr:hypothetical protein [Sphingobium indicum]CCW18081.1 hypothetical protein EBBID32_24310 [Sphingobium indicum BiD32]
MATALAAERVAHKPVSPWANRLKQEVTGSSSAATAATPARQAAWSVTVKG